MPRSFEEDSDEGYIKAKIVYVGFADQLGLEEIAVIQDLLLIEVRVYQSGSVLRANLHFKSRRDNLVLRNYRASDAIALAAYYDIPIKVRKSLFEEAIEQ